MKRSTSSAIVAGSILFGSFFGRAALAQQSPPVMSHDILARLVRVCAPEVNSTTQAAIVAVESGGSPWVLHDDNNDRVYSPMTLPSARSFAQELLVRNKAIYGVRDRGVDFGLAQINSSNFTSLGVTANDMLDPCANLNASARIISSAYLHERTLLSADPSWHGDERALERALEEYNSGRPSGDDGYVRAIFATLDGSLVRQVGSGARVTPLRVIPITFPTHLERPIQEVRPSGSMFANRPTLNATVRGHGSLFYHQDIPKTGNSSR